MFWFGNAEVRHKFLIGTYFHIDSLNSLALKYNAHVATRVIYADYRGNIAVGLYNQCNIPHTFNLGDWIAQLVLEKAEPPLFK